ncbi:MAG: spermidine/putrescine ABC transporter substrate-binding protein, partial [Acidimicrobiales bacterium]
MRVLVLSLVLVAAACGDDSDSESAGGDSAGCEVDETDGDLAIYNWAEYIDQEELDAFAEEFDVGVTMDTYDSNEAMQPIITAGNSGYDLIV